MTDRGRQLGKIGGAGLALVLFAVALYTLRRELGSVDYGQVKAELAAVPTGNLLVALAFTALSYLTYTFYDLIALRHFGRSIPYKRLALPTGLAYVLSANLGSLLGGVAFRFRLYSREGLGLAEVASIFLFTGLSFWLGGLTMASVVFTLAPPPMPDFLPLPWATLRPAGFVALALVGLYLGLTVVLRGRTLTIRKHVLALPRPQLALAQVAVATADWFMISSVFVALMPAGGGVTYAEMLGAFMLAETAGLVSHVPGGLGVFETVALGALTPALPVVKVMGALVMFRVVYFLAPLVPALVLLVAYEWRARRPSPRLTEWSDWLGDFVPGILGTVVLLGGLTLLLSGATPPVHGRMRLLAHVLPLGIVETAHMLASIAGALLLVLAYAVMRRLDAAWYGALIALGLGAGLCLVRGLDYEEALVLLAFAAVLLPFRKEFDRRSALTGDVLSPVWLAAVGLALIATLWLGGFAFKHVEYRDDLWWTFTFHRGAPRALRASVAAFVVMLLMAFGWLLRPVRRRLKGTSSVKDPAEPK